MIKEIKLPEIADNVDEATILEIRVAVGDKIEKDDTIAELESDKAAFELPSDVSGTVKEIKVSEGDEVKVGQVVITVETEETASSQPSRDDGTGSPKEEESETSQEEESPQERDKEKAASPQPSLKSGPSSPKEGEEEKEAAEEKEEEKEEEGEKEKEKEDKKQTSVKEKEDKSSREQEVAASPSVRRLAREIGVDIYNVEGTGPENRITTDDVKAFAKAALTGKDQGGPATGDFKLPDFSKWGEIRREKMDSIRRRTATRMVDSWQSIPHVFQFDKADVTQLESFRKKYGKHVEKEGGKLTVTSILLKITAQALVQFPDFNASLDLKNQEVIYKDYVHIGVAVDTDRGLLVPIVKDADKKSIVELSVELSELAEKARTKKIMPDELQGGNFAISNLGGIGGTNFTPIVYQPNVAILGISRSQTEPVWNGSDFEPRMMLPLSLSYDHRLIDGAQGARFLRWLCEALENPLLTLF